MKETTKQSVSILMITLVFASAIFVLNKFTLCGSFSRSSNPADKLYCKKAGRNSIIFENKFKIDVWKKAKNNPKNGNTI